MLDTRDQLLKVLRSAIAEIDPDALANSGSADFGETRLSALRMDSLSLLELGMAVSTEVGVEVEFLEVDPDITLGTLADGILLQIQQV